MNISAPTKASERPPVRREMPVAELMPVLARPEPDVSAAGLLPLAMLTVGFIETEPDVAPVARITTLTAVEAAVGVPLITPVDEFMESPAGKR